MKKAYLTVLLVAVVCAALPVAGLRAAEWQDFEISDTNSSEHAERPDIHGSIVVWHQLVGDDYDIYAADITSSESPSVFVIAAYLDDQNAPAIYENTVVWQDYLTETGWDIYGTDLSNPAALFPICALNHAQIAPEIYQNTVVWQDNREGDWDIYAADITDACSPREHPVAYFLGHQRSPAVYQNMVVWQDGNEGDFDVYSTDITDPNNREHFFVAAFDFNQQAPAIYATTVVWDDDFFGDRDIFAADIYEPARPIEFAISWQSSSETNPDIDGHIVVWQDDRYGNWDIFGYNLTTGQEFQITDDPYDQTHPGISENTVVWQDNRSESWEIYGAILDGPEVAQCTASMAGDVNADCRVDFYDFAEMAADWLECGLEPQEACL